MVSFFVISFVTNILGPIMPQATSDLNLTLAQAGILPFAFFIAYIISLPAGYMLEKYGAKFVITLAFVIGAIGSLIFAVHPNYMTYLIGLFIVGACVAMLQTAFWPLLRTAGGEEHYSFNSVLTQIFFGAASFISPLVYSYLVLNLPKNANANFFLEGMSKLVPQNLSWVSIYWLNALVMIVMIVIITLIKFPKVELTETEKLEGLGMIKSLIKNPIVIFYFFGIFCYVGQEQGISVWMSKFLQDYHGFDANTTGAKAVALFWAMQSVGSLLGIVLLKLFDVKKILVVFLLAQLISLSLALFGSANVSLVAFVVCGFLTSVMYGSIFSLGMNSLAAHHGSVSGIFCTGIIGGAVVPLLVGALGNITNLRLGMCLVYLTILFMLFISLTAKPLVKNKTIFDKE
ncbi:MAG TPA: MFS transporter [Lentisphaeria bacterium]|nr:MFS transporter [Lentisphaeria bacterium]